MLMTLLTDENGATAIEYGLIAALISIVAIVAMSSVGGNIKNVFSTVARNLSTATR